MPADEIGEIEWQLWVDRLSSEGLSRSRIASHIAVASAIYAWALTPTRRFVTRNPTRLLELPPNDEKPRLRVAFAAEAKQLLAALEPEDQVPLTMGRTPKRSMQPVPRYALTRAEAAASLGMSLNHFERRVQPDLRVVLCGQHRLLEIDPMALVPLAAEVPHRANEARRREPRAGATPAPPPRIHLLAASPKRPSRRTHLHFMRRCPWSLRVERSPAVGLGSRRGGLTRHLHVARLRGLTAPWSCRPPRPRIPA